LLGNGVLACQTAAPGLLEAYLAEVVSNRLRLAGERGQHVALAQVHKRVLPLVEDNAEDLVFLQRQRRDLLRDHLVATAGEEALPELEPRVVAESPDRPRMRETIQEGREVEEEVQAYQEAKLREDMRRNDEGHEDDEPEPLLRWLEVNTTYEELEELIIEEMDICASRQCETRSQIFFMEDALLGLETGFAVSRKEMLQRDRELAQRIAEAEAELAATADGLAGAREAERAREDEAREAQLELAEQMVLVPPGPESEALERQLLVEIQALQVRSEELQKKLARAKTSAKRR